MRGACLSAGALKQNRYKDGKRRYGMDAEFFFESPFRSPQWRSDRVVQLVTHRKGPMRVRRFDDRYVRTNRYFLLQYLAAGDDENKLDEVIAEWPHVYCAHLMQFGPDQARRDILQARLLTGEPRNEVAKRFAMAEDAVEFYEKLYFDVRDRLGSRDWIAKVVLQTSRLMASSHYGITPEEQRGLLYRFFAYHGGPLVLDAVITGLAHTTMPQREEDVGEWFDDALAQSIRARAAAAALSMEINKENVIRLLKLAFRAKEAGKNLKAGAQVSQAEREKKAGEIMAAIDRSASLWKRPEFIGEGPSQRIDPVEPHVNKEPAATAEQVATDYERDADLLNSADLDAEAAGEPILESLAI